MKLQLRSIVKVCLSGLFIFSCCVANLAAQELSNPFRDSLIVHEKDDLGVIVEGMSLTEAAYRPSEVADENIVLTAPAAFFQEGSVLQTQPETVTPEPTGETTVENVNPEDGIVIQGDIVYGASLGESLGCDGGIGCGNLGICADGCLIPCPRIDWQKWEFLTGVSGFTGPANRGGHGSFGFNEGFNWTSSLDRIGNGYLTAQAGFRAVQSGLSGTEFTEEDRKQTFVTLGLFRRADWGLQGGAVVDYMHDDWYYDMDLLQVRAELSWIYPSGHEFGFWMATDADHAQTRSRVGVPFPSTITEEWRSTDLYAFFFRCTSCETGAVGRIFGGFTGSKDGLIGADLTVPVATQWAIDTEFTYLIPEEGSGPVGSSEEGWNVGLYLVYYPGCKTAYDKNYNKPLFDTAGNGNFFVDRK